MAANQQDHADFKVSTFNSGKHNLVGNNKSRDEELFGRFQIYFFFVYYLISFIK